MTVTILVIQYLSKTVKGQQKNLYFFEELLEFVNKNLAEF